MVWFSSSASNKGFAHAQIRVPVQILCCIPGLCISAGMDPSLLQVRITLISSNTWSKSDFFQFYCLLGWFVIKYRIYLICIINIFSLIFLSFLLIFFTCFRPILFPFFYLFVLIYQCDLTLSWTTTPFPKKL